MPTTTGHTKAIRASVVIGADVYESTGEKIGKVEDIILDKTTNRTMFVVISVGGAVTTSANCSALPWAVLDYEEDKQGYVVPFTKAQIAKGPTGSITELIKGDGAEPRAAAYAHYNIAKDW